MKFFISSKLALLLTCFAVVFISFNGLHGQTLTWQETDHVKDFPSHCLLNHKQRIYSGTIGAGLLFTDDDGDTWQRVDKLTSDFIVDLIAIDNRTLLGATRDQGVVISEDDGESWRTFNEGLEMYRTNCLFEEKGVLFVGTDLGLYRLLPEESSWEKLTLPKGVKNSKLIMAIGGFRETLFAGGPGVLYYSLDGGDSWESINEGFDHNVISLLWQANHLYIGTTGDGLLRTDGPGRDRIDNLTNGVFDQAINSVWRLREINGKIFKLTSSRGLANDSITINDGLESLEVRDILKHGRYYFLASATQGVLRTDKDLGSQNLSGYDAASLTLLAYPTVSTGEVSIDLSGLSEDTDTEIMFVDSRGQLVKTLTVQRQKSAHAHQRIRLDDFADGSYWIVAKNGTQLSRQLVIINR